MPLSTSPALQVTVDSTSPAKGRHGDYIHGVHSPFDDKDLAGDNDHGGGPGMGDTDLERQQWRYKAVALLAILLMSAGEHYISNSLSSLKSTLKKELDITNTQYGILSGAISLVNTILPFLVGVIMDMFGPGWGAFASCTAVALGNFITILGTYTGKFSLLVVGRVCFGLGSSTIVTAQETMLSHWFRGKGLALSIGVQIMVSKVFGWLASATVVEVAERTGFYGNAFWVGEGLALFSLLMVVVYGLMMYKLRRSTAAATMAAAQGSIEETGSVKKVGGGGMQAPHLSTANGGLTAHSNPLTSSKVDTTTSTLNPGGTSPVIGLSSTPAAAAPLTGKKRISWRQLYYIIYFPDIYWYLPSTELLMGAVWTPFLGIAAEYVQKRWHEKTAVAAWKSSISLAVPIVGSPLMGLLIDRFGARGPLVITSSVFLLIAILLLGWTYVPPEVGLTLFSCSLTFGPVALISAVPLYLPLNMVGTGIGLIKCGLNFGIIIVDVLIGRLQDLDDDSYDRVMVMMLVLAVMSVVNSMAFMGSDYRWEDGLQSAGYARRNRLMAARMPVEKAIAAAAAANAEVPRYRYVYPAVCLMLFIISWTIYSVFLLVK
ncbi:hypothetical protein IWQ60_002259 [Tieghemiomyces parasiticus]|uniref:Lysosomal dipeptide transporter MFSD1 n=1 Tax=Tieghemiomyces parasiticus TaxID=78921 RepID=A0A9W8ACN1_9FUNG|nr:hypothetical protein IWQ60_002259 [Tieghemiomyces parasiticus]